MRFSDLLRVSIRQLLRHRRRYWGVMLAIALGTAGFITIIPMGRDLKKNFNRDLELLAGPPSSRFTSTSAPNFSINAFPKPPSTACAIFPA